MDPNATMAIIYDADADTTDRIEALQALVRWIDRGGFLPKGYRKASALRADLSTQRILLHALRAKEMRASARRALAAESID